MFLVDFIFATLLDHAQPLGKYIFKINEKTGLLRRISLKSTIIAPE